MKKANVENWCELAESRSKEGQIKGFIANTVEGYLNGIQFGYEPMTREEWKQYIIKALNKDIEMNVISNGIERNHLRFVGNERFHSLIDTYLNNYTGVQAHIKHC